MLRSPGTRLLRILSPGLVPSMDYLISSRALDHTELYLDSQNKCSALREGVRGYVPHTHTQTPARSHAAADARQQAGNSGAVKCPNAGAGLR